MAAVRILDRPSLPTQQPLREELASVVSRRTTEIVGKLDALRDSRSLVSRDPRLMPVSTQRSLEEKLFDARARAKTLTANVAMHLDSDWRNKLFRQLDSLHELDEWDDRDHPLLERSFNTFLRAIISLNPERRPGLGISSRGNLIGAWTTGKDRLTIEFLPEDHARLVLVISDGANAERAALELPIQKLKERLQPYSPARWFENAGDHKPPA